MCFCWIKSVEMRAKTIFRQKQSLVISLRRRHQEVADTESAFTIMFHPILCRKHVQATRMWQNCHTFVLPIPTNGLILEFGENSFIWPFSFPTFHLYVYDCLLCSFETLNLWIWGHIKVESSKFSKLSHHNFLTKEYFKFETLMSCQILTKKLLECSILLQKDCYGHI